MVNGNLKGILLSKDCSGRAYQIRQVLQQRNVKLEICSDFSYFFLNIDIFKFDFVFADSTTMEINSDLISVFTNPTSRFFIPAVVLLNDKYMVE